MKKSRIRIILAMMIILFIGVAGCSERNESEGQKEELTLMLDWYPNAVHSFLYVAQEKGYFEEEGLDVTIEMPSDVNDPLRLAAAGKIDLAINYQNQLIMSQEEGIPIKGIASIVQKPLGELMFKQEAGIASPKDLEGKSIGLGTSMVPQAIVRAMIEQDGGNPDAVEFIDVGYDLVPALATDRVDALMGAYINHELLLLEKEGYPIATIPREEYGIPAAMELIFVAGDETISEKPETLKKFLRAVKKGQEDVVANPEDGLQILLDHQNQDSALDPEVEQQSLDILLPLMGSDARPFGWQNAEQFQEVIDWMEQAGIITDSFDAETVFVDLLNE
jgi:putative hydroxymethylpyrimidine transport system substrate-binding protein